MRSLDASWTSGFATLTMRVADAVLDAEQKQSASGYSSIYMSGTMASFRQDGTKTHVGLEVVVNKTLAGSPYRFRVTQPNGDSEVVDAVTGQRFSYGRDGSLKDCNSRPAEALVKSGQAFGEIETSVTTGGCECWLGSGHADSLHSAGNSLHPPHPTDMMIKTNEADCSVDYLSFDSVVMGVGLNEIAIPSPAQCKAVHEAKHTIPGLTLTPPACTNETIADGSCNVIAGAGSSSRRLTDAKGRRLAWGASLDTRSLWHVARAGYRSPSKQQGCKDRKFHQLYSCVAEDESSWGVGSAHANLWFKNPTGSTPGMIILSFGGSDDDDGRLKGCTVVYSLFTWRVLTYSTLLPSLRLVRQHRRGHAGLGHGQRQEGPPRVLRALHVDRAVHSRYHHVARLL